MHCFTYGDDFAIVENDAQAEKFEAAGETRPIGLSRARQCSARSAR